MVRLHEAAAVLGVGTGSDAAIRSRSGSPSTVGLCHSSSRPERIASSIISIMASMFGSFMVATHSTPSRMPVTSVTYAANRSIASGPPQPPASANQRGLLKWCRVTTGVSPNDCAVSIIRR
ncbi:hypothetical protein GCM10025877_16220 [Agromyces mangrovi Wang et al. 2018]|nr:hypothetical protein GCM10025877_16220 [Agromyces mangrovi]